MKYVIDHWKRIILLIVFILSTVLFFHWFAEILPIKNNVQVIKIFGITLQNWGTILAISGTIFTSIWAMFQYDKNRSLAQQGKASFIADELSGYLGECIEIITMILLDNKEYSNIVTVIIQSNKLKMFDRYEIKDIFNFGNEGELDKFFKKNLKSIFSKQAQDNYKKILNERYRNEQINKFPKEFEFLVNSTLSRLEYLCMNISSNAAGTSFLYPSYHEDFLMLIKLLSILICSKNTDFADKKYINIIEVFNLWNRRRNKDVEIVKLKKRLIEKIDRSIARTKKAEKT